MAAIIGALRAQLTLDTAAFLAGSKTAGKASKSLQNSLIPMRKAMLGVAAAVAAAGAGLAIAIKGSLNAADDMGKAAQKFGVPVEALSRLKYAADLSDVSLGTLGTGLQQLSKKMLAAADGGKAPVALFKEMGVEVVDAAGKLRDTEAVLQDVAEVFATMPDGAEKTALAMKLFGKAGGQLIPLLNAGKTGLAAMADEANRLGVVISTDTAKSAENFNDNLTRLKAAMGGVIVQITAALAPSLEKLSEFAVNVANSFGELSPATKDMVLQIGSILGVVAIAAAAFGALAFVISPISVTMGLIAGAAVLIYTNWDGLAQFFSETWASIKTSTSEAWESIKASIGGGIDWITAKWNGFLALLEAGVEKIKAVGNAIAEALSFGEAELNSGEIGGMGGALDGSADMFGGATLDPSSFKTTGAAGADGLVDGFRSRLAERKSEILAAADSITTGVRDRWQVASPSKVFREIGQFLTEGLSLGITDNVPMVNTAIGEVGDALEGDGNSLQSRLEGFKSTMESAFVGLVTGAKSFKEALSDLAKSLAEMLAKSAFQGLFGKLLGGIFGGGTTSGTSTLGSLFANGAAFSGGRVTAFASGGVVDGATAFAMQGGMGVMGEAGPEAIMPLTRGPGGKLGVKAHGGGGGQVINIDARGAVEGTDALIAKRLGEAFPAFTQGAVQAMRSASARGR